jgi:Zn-dependent protease
MSMRFRSALFPHVWLAVLLGLACGAGARFAHLPAPDLIGSTFWTYALGIGALVFFLRWVAVYRRSGVIVDDTSIAPAANPSRRIAFADVKRLRLVTREVPSNGNVVFVRVAIVEGPANEIAFADLRHASREAGIIDVIDSGLLLAILAERLGTPGLLPDAEATTSTEPIAANPSTTRGIAQAWALVPLFAKLGGKLYGLVAALFKFVKTGAVLVKPGWAAVSIAAYAIVFDWRFGLLLLFMIFWHEYGHVHAMRKIGVPVRGIYFIPFLGGAAVHQAPITNRWDQVYVDLNGPLWGGALAVVALGVFYATGGDTPFWAALASWWALINLFNLLPVLPLDGGRTLSAIAFSINSQLSALLVFGGLLAGAAVAISFRMELLALLAVIGAMEFGGELAAARWRVAMRGLSKPERLDFETWRKLQGLTRAVAAGDDSPRALAQDRALYDRRRAIALGKPMTRRQLAIAIAGYAALVAALLATMLVVRDVPGADVSAMFLHS